MHNVGKTVFILGTEGIPARYGGFETFADKLICNRIDKTIKYYVTYRSIIGKSKNKSIYKYNGAVCVPIVVPEIGGTGAILYDILSLQWTIGFINSQRIRDAVIYMCGCTIGAFMPLFKWHVKKAGAKFVVNPDGHEWERAKWSFPIRLYLKLSDRMIIKYSDHTVCDSRAIGKYIKVHYRNYGVKTSYIAYGADIDQYESEDDKERYLAWCKKWNIEPGEYYLNIGRFVPENNYETMIGEFLASDTKRSFVFVSTRDEERYKELNQKLNFESDSRIKFVGEIYDAKLLSSIRNNSYAYIHGHSVGGTNPSLLEAMGTGKLCLLYDVEYNREVANSASLYWSKSNGNLRKLIEEADNLDKNEIEVFEKMSIDRIKRYYSWNRIVRQCESLFREI